MADTLHTPIDALRETMLDMGVRARAASARLAKAGPDGRTRAIRAMANALSAAEAEILAANQSDLAGGRDKGLSDALLDRLALTPERVQGIAAALEAVAELGDPVGQELARWTVPSGLDIARVSTPLGVIGIVYEARPNVTADAAALCIRSGNAAILRAGSESLQSSIAIANALRVGLKSEGLPEDSVQLVQTTPKT